MKTKIMAGLILLSGLSAHAVTRTWTCEQIGNEADRQFVMVVKDGLVFKWIKLFWDAGNLQRGEKPTIEFDLSNSVSGEGKIFYSDSSIFGTNSFSVDDTVMNEDVNEVNAVFNISTPQNILGDRGHSDIYNLKCRVNQ